MQLHSLDWIVIVFTLFICFVPALYYRKRAGQNTAEFFVSGRSVPWWLAGLSMVATTFSSDTPNLVTDIVRRTGVAGNWVWWAFTLTGVATVFFYARLWRRSEVMTDLEFYEIRYSGGAASFVRGFRSVYLGFLFNCIIMATVNLAACKIAAIMFGLSRFETLLVVGLLNVVFAALTGLWGVLIIDMIQFFTMMTAVIAAAFFAVRAAGGLGTMITKVSAMTGPGGINFLSMLPNFRSNWDLAIAIFIMPLAVQWWAVWYPGAEPGGGSYIAQRMLASKSEKDSLGAVLFFNLAHYVLRPWPWILVALSSLVIFPQLSDIQKAFPHLDVSLLGHDIAYPAMMKFLPVGFLGLLVGGLIAANSSTNLTHLNWGASYLVHDFYRRFINKTASEKHYVLMGRLATIALFFAAGSLVFVLETALDSFKIILQVGAGTGLLYLVRWFWWRVTAWCEVTAMISSFAFSVLLLVLRKLGFPVPDHYALILTVIVTTVSWMITAYVGPQTDKAQLVKFYRKVHPFGPGWKPIRRLAGVAAVEGKGGHSFQLALVGWISGSLTIWSALFTVGNVLYGRWVYAGVLFAVFVAAGLVLLRVVRRLWANGGDAAPGAAAGVPAAK
jgi:SSS family solute:Na+ symporter